jgi:hypothetical protein
VERPPSASSGLEGPPTRTGSLSPDSLANVRHSDVSSMEWASSTRPHSEHTVSPAEWSKTTSVARLHSGQKESPMSSSSSSSSSSLFSTFSWPGRERIVIFSLLLPSSTQMMSRWIRKENHAFGSHKWCRLLLSNSCNVTVTCLSLCAFFSHLHYSILGLALHFPYLFTFFTCLASFRFLFHVNFVPFLCFIHTHIISEYLRGPTYY